MKLISILTVAVLAGLSTYNTKAFANDVALAYIFDGISSASNIQAAITEYYWNNEKFPTTNKELGLPRPNKLATRSLRSIKISRGGSIVLVYNEKSGIKYGIVKLIPDAKNFPNRGIEWKCFTPSYKEVGIPCKQINK